MLSPILYRASRSTATRRAVEHFPVTRSVVQRFVAGDTAAEAVDAAVRALSGGISSSLDLLGEDVNDLNGASRTRDAYVALLHCLDDAGVTRNTEVSLKLSAVGQALPRHGDEVALTHAREICAAADAVGSHVTLDMEDHSTVERTLAIGRELRRQFPKTGNVLQSNLNRTEADIATLSEEGRATGASPRIRLVKGAYKEPPSVAYQKKTEVDLAYTRGIAAMMHSPLYPMVATHDPSMIDHARRCAVSAGRGARNWEIQMLYGIRTDLQQEVASAGPRMRVYIPFGTDWYPYFMRRLAERPANVAFFLRALRRN